MQRCIASLQNKDGQMMPSEPKTLVFWQTIECCTGRQVLFAGRFRCLIGWDRLSQMRPFDHHSRQLGRWPL